MPSVILGEFIRRRRFARRIAIRELAGVTGLGIRRICDIESGRDVPSRDERARLATAVRVDEEVLAEKAPRASRADDHKRPSTPAHPSWFSEGTDAVPLATLGARRH
jgi:transcriptional regulator with XRE-family HTH domain